MSGKDRFDNMIPFFGRSNDKRVRLYLHALETEFKVNRKVALTANHIGGASGIAPELRNKFFLTPDPTRSDDAVHPEWDTFANNLENRLGSLTLVGNPRLNRSAGASPAAAAAATAAVVAAADILVVIKSLAGVASLNTQLEFFQEVVKMHLNSLTDGTNDLMGRPSAWDKATSFQFKSPRELSRIYNGAGIIYNYLVAPDDAIVFTYNLSKYALYALLESAAATSLGKDNFWSTTEEVTNKFYRNPSDPLKVLTTDATGAQVDVSRGSDAYFKLNMKDKCMGTNVKTTPSLTCDNYFMKCIVNGSPDDISACKSFMLDADFWNIMQSDVDAMLPSIIVDTLDKFGFQMDATNKKYKSYESVGSWLRKLSARVPIQLSEVELKNITDNIKLTQYLGLLVAKVNQNPAILNENYFESSHFNPQEQSFRFKGWTPYGLTPRVFIRSDTSSDIARQASFITTNFARTRSSAQRRLTLLNGSSLLHYGVPFSIGVAPSFIGMFGGGHDEEVFAKQGDVLENLLNKTKSQLLSMGKTLDVDTQSQIQRHIAQYRDSENKLHKAIAYAEKYIDLIQVFKQYDESNVLNIDHLKSFVGARDKYFDKAETRQNTIISAIQQIADGLLEKLDNDPKDMKIPSRVAHTRHT